MTKAPWYLTHTSLTPQDLEDMQQREHALSEGTKTVVDLLNEFDQTDPGSPHTAPQARSVLEPAFASPGANLSELLASAPLEGVDLDRPRDAGRLADV